MSDATEIRWPDQYHPRRCHPEQREGSGFSFFGAA